MDTTNNVDQTYSVHIQGSGSLNNSIVGGVNVVNANTMFAERHKRSFLSDDGVEIEGRNEEQSA